MQKIFLALVVIGLSITGFLMLKDEDAPEPEVPAAIQEGRPLTDEQVEEIVRMVGQHIKLPDETPEIGIVTDIEMLRASQPFYEGAENGDILLLYPSVSRAILFDPDQDVIINVGPVMFENPEGGPTE